MAHVFGSCAVCFVKTDKKCGNCQLVNYCCKNHQKTDWKRHKIKCYPFQVATNADIGRHLVATRKITANEEIIREKPLVTGPLQKTPPVCLGCYKLLSELSAKSCSRCGWPLCGSTCENSRDHIPECEITIKYRQNKVAIKSFGIIHPSYEAITVLRCIYMRTANFPLWEQIINLQSDINYRIRDENYENDRRTIAQFIPNFFKITDFSEEDLMKVLGIININGHEVPVFENSAVSVYGLGSFLKHDCRANCTKSFGPAGELIIRSAVDIELGEHLSICYTDPLWGTQQRRKDLLSTKYFQCFCMRCSDPTECRTHFSSIKCDNEDCKGLMLQNDMENWICNACKKEICNNKIDQFLQLAMNLMSCQTISIKSCEKFIENHKSLLHSNHFLLTKANLQLLQMVCRELAQMSYDDLQKQLEISLTLYDLITLLVPAETRCRGILIYQQVLLLKESENRKQNLEDDANNKSKTKKYKELLELCYNLLKGEAPVLQEGQIAMTVADELKKLESVKC